MKNYLTILAIAAVSFCLINSGCQSENIADTKPIAAQPAGTAEAEAKVESAAKPKAKPTTRSRPSHTRRARLYGDWDVKIDSDGREWESLLAFSRDADGKQTGQWISFWGIAELSDVTYEDGKLSFARTRRNREGEPSTSTFTGTFEDGKLTGTILSDRGDSTLQGERSARLSRAVGNWKLKLKMGEREFESTLAITADADGELAGQWKSQRGEHQINDVKYSRGKLSFKRTSKMDDRQWESTFEGAVRGNTLSGMITSDSDEITVKGKRLGESLIGTWNINVMSERGSRKQRLKVNPDMSGLYGNVDIDKVNLEGDKVSFKIVMEYGERKFEMSFEGKLDEAKLTGKLTTSRGTQKVMGTKVVRKPRTRSTR